MAKMCKSCGAMADDHDKFCENCGSNLADADIPVVTEVQAEVVDAEIIQPPSATKAPLRMQEKCGSVWWAARPNTICPVLRKWKI